MSQLTNYGENKFADYIRGQGMSLASSFSLALLTAATESSFTEVSWTGYARQTVARSLTAWSGTQNAGSTLASTGTSHQTSNNAAVDFGVVGSGGSATISHVGLFDGSNMFAYAPLSTPLVVSAADPVNFAPGSIIWTLGLTGGLSDYFSNKLIDVVWRDQSFVMPTSLFARLLTSAPTNAGGGTEVGQAGYARQAIASSMAAWSGTQGPGTIVPSTGTSGRISNNADIVYAAPGADWGTVGHMALNDSASGGNLMFWRALTTPKTINTGGPAPRFLSDTLGITFA